MIEYRDSVFGVLGFSRSEVQVFPKKQSSSIHWHHDEFSLARVKKKIVFRARARKSDFVFSPMGQSKLAATSTSSDYRSDPYLHHLEGAVRSFQLS
jgi:hypothetical protein